MILWKYFSTENFEFFPAFSFSPFFVTLFFVSQPARLLENIQPPQVEGWNFLITFSFSSSLFQLFSCLLVHLFTLFSLSFFSDPHRWLWTANGGKMSRHSPPQKKQLCWNNLGFFTAHSELLRCSLLTGAVWRPFFHLKSTKSSTRRDERISTRNCCNLFFMTMSHHNNKRMFLLYNYLETPFWDRLKFYSRKKEAKKTLKLSRFLLFFRIFIKILNQEYKVFYVGTDNGRVYKIVQFMLNGESKSSLLDIYEVAQDEPIQVMQISQKRKSLYVSTDNRIKQIDLAMCTRRYDSCFRCVKDPYCGWDENTGVCKPYELGLIQVSNV